MFPTEGVTATVVVEADDVRAAPRGRGHRRPAQAGQAAPKSFLPGTEVDYSQDGTVAKIEVPTRGNGTDAASAKALDEMRDDDHPGDGRAGSTAPR